MFADEDLLVGPQPSQQHPATAATSSSSSVTSLAASLSKKLIEGQYDCAMCMSNVSFGHQLWSCKKCFGVFHFTCTQSWAKLNPGVGTDEVDEGKKALHRREFVFPCPTCRHQGTMPSHCQCYCGQAKEPKTDAALPPGSCGGICSKKREDASCSHPCTDICHPGPCSPCSHFRDTHCYCDRKTPKRVGCSSGIHGYSCENVCDRMLNCGKHRCQLPCHEGECPECIEVIADVSCQCGQTKMERRCTKDTSFLCGLPCPKLKSCGNHPCGKQCHHGECDTCERDPKVVASCACGQTPFHLMSSSAYNEERKSCTDPIPTCGKTCGKPLGCGDHFCQEPCHDSPCPPCMALVKLPCQCGVCNSAAVRCFFSYLPKEEWRPIAERKGLPKREQLKEFPWRCDRRCKVTKTCGRHKCENVCCGEGDAEDHICMLECKKKAPCGIHICGQLCHRGPCPPCTNTSFEPLYCRCRRSVLEPPIPCGTPPPACNHPCVIPRPCGHPSNHTCHPADSMECPPCVVPVAKRCGSHNTKMDWHMPCHVTPSCGKQCNKPTKCCGRRCTKPCHSGPCVHNNCKHGGGLDADPDALESLENALSAGTVQEARSTTTTTGGSGSLPVESEEAQPTSAPAGKKKRKKMAWGS